MQVGDAGASAVGDPDQVVFFFRCVLVPFGAWGDQAVCGFVFFGNMGRVAIALFCFV